MKPKTHDWTVEDYEEYRRDIVRRSQAKRRERAKELGLCPICCVREPEEDRKSCEVCCKRARDYAHAHYVKRQRRRGRPKKRVRKKGSHNIK